MDFLWSKLKDPEVHYCSETVLNLFRYRTKAIDNHTLDFTELMPLFQDLVLVEGVSCADLDLLRPEVKVVSTAERRLKGYRIRSKRPVKNGTVLHVGYWKLESNPGSFTQDFVENLGVTEVVASFLLRNSIDIMIFQVKVRNLHIRSSFHDFRRQTLLYTVIIHCYIKVYMINSGYSK